MPLLDKRLKKKQIKNYFFIIVTLVCTFYVISEKKEGEREKTRKFSNLNSVPTHNEYISMEIFENKHELHSKN